MQGSKEYTKEEKKENRKEFVKDPIGYFSKPLINYWRNNTKKALWDFFSRLIFVLLLMTFLQSIYFDGIYCKSTLEEFNGKVMQKYEGFIEEVERRQETYDPYMNETKKQEYALQGIEIIEPEEIHCTYNFTRWKQDEWNIMYNWKKILLRQ